MTEEPKLNDLIPELLCSDIRTSKAFYINVLGFHVLYEREEAGFAMLERGQAQIMLDEVVADSPRSWIAAPLKKPFGRGMNLEIRADSVDKLYQQVQAAKADIFLPIEDKEYRADDRLLVVRQFIVKDPDGYLLRFSQRMGSKPAALRP